MFGPTVLMQVKVIKLRKRKYMPPLLLASASFLNGIVWAVISGIQSDGYIMVSFCYSR